MSGFVYPDQYRKSNYREPKVNSAQVHREVLSPEAMDDVISGLLRQHGKLMTGQLMKLSRAYPTHTEVRESLRRIGATQVKRVYWSL